MKEIRKLYNIIEIEKLNSTNLSFLEILKSYCQNESENSNYLMNLLPMLDIMTHNHHIIAKKLDEFVVIS